MPTIETDRLLLRDFQLTDWNALNAILTDPEVAGSTRFAAWDEAKRRAWLQQIVAEADNQARDAYQWAVTLHDDGRLIGWVGIGKTTHDDADIPGTRECGFLLARAAWGHGYMREALGAVIRYEFETLKTPAIISKYVTQDAAATHVMQKCSMTYEGVFIGPDIEGNWAARNRYIIQAPSTS